MGKSIDMPEAYDLEELLDHNVRLNRFDASNPFGTQNWTLLPDGRYSLDQQITPELQQALDNQIAYANQPAKQFNFMEHAAPYMGALGGAIAERAGIQLPQGGEKAPMVTNAPLPMPPDAGRPPKEFKPKDSTPVKKPNDPPGGAPAPVDPDPGQPGSPQGPDLNPRFGPNDIGASHRGTFRGGRGGYLNPGGGFSSNPDTGISYGGSPSTGSPSQGSSGSSGSDSGGWSETGYDYGDTGNGIIGTIGDWWDSIFNKGKTNDLDDKAKGK